MAREILFKAKRIDNGEWVEGSIITRRDTKRVFMVDIENITALRSVTTNYCDRYDWRAVEVQADTICQYTGLTDKNGNKIWENDVCTCKKRGCAFFGCVVKWNQVKARFDVNAMGCNFSMTLEECLDGVSINGLDYEVIGNIFDNPELLGG